jgi:hypothetical protein
MLCTGQSTFPELQQLETRFGDLALIHENDFQIASDKRVYGN